LPPFSGSTAAVLNLKFDYHAAEGRQKLPATILLTGYSIDSLSPDAGRVA